jgi:hypothetical protein
MGKIGCDCTLVEVHRRDLSTAGISEGHRPIMTPKPLNGGLSRYLGRSEREIGIPSDVATLLRSASLISFPAGDNAGGRTP